MDIYKFQKIETSSSQHFSAKSPVFQDFPWIPLGFPHGSAEAAFGGRLPQRRPPEAVAPQLRARGQQQRRDALVAVGHGREQRRRFVS